MTYYGWTNSDGEPIMDGAAYRFEQQLDDEYAQQRFEEEFYQNYSDEPTCDNIDYDDQDADGRFWCFGCDEYADHTVTDFADPIEDQWLDGSYEE